MKNEDRYVKKSKKIWLKTNKTKSDSQPD